MHPEHPKPIGDHPSVTWWPNKQHTLRETPARGRVFRAGPDHAGMAAPERPQSRYRMSSEGAGCLSTDSVDQIAQAEPELVQRQHEDQNAHDREQHALHSEPPLRELVEARRNRLGWATFAVCSFESMAESTPPSGAFTMMP